MAGMSLCGSWLLIDGGSGAKHPDPTQISPPRIIIRSSRIPKGSLPHLPKCAYFWMRPVESAAILSPPPVIGGGQGWGAASICPGFAPSPPPLRTPDIAPASREGHTRKPHKVPAEVDRPVIHDAAATTP